MTNITNELFLLLTNLSQFKSKKVLVKVFIESINSIFSNHDFEWIELKTESKSPCLEVCTHKNKYGYIQYKNRDSFTEETFSLFQNAVQLFGIHLEKLEQETFLKNQTEHLDHLVKEKTEQLTASQKELEIKKEETEKQNQELREKNTFIQTILDNLPIGLAANYIDTNTAYYMNKKMEEIYGWPRKDILTVETFFEHVYPDPEYREEITTQIIDDIQSGDPSRMHWENIKITTSDGSEKYINAVNIPLLEQNTMISTVMDVNDLNITKNELFKAKEIAEANEIIKSKMVENIGDVIAIIDEQGINRYKSPNIKKLFGWDHEELVGKSAFDNVHPNDLEKSQAFFNEIFSTPNKTGSEELRYKHKDGKYTWIQFTACNLFEDPVIKGILGNYHDISEQKRHEQQIIDKNIEYEKLNKKLARTNKELIEAKEKAEDSEEKFSTIFNMSQAMICVADINTATFKFVNPAFKRILGYDEEELLSKPFFEFVHPDDIKLTQEVVEKQLKKGKKILVFENRYRRQDGGYSFLQWNSFPNVEKGLTFAIAHDVTEQRLIQNELRDTKERYELASYIGKVGTWDWDIPSGDLIWNDETYRLLGFEPGAVKPSYELFLEMVHQDDRETLDKNVKAAWYENKPYFIDTRLVQNTGQIISCHITGKVDYDKLGNPLRMLGTIQDISDRKKVEEELHIAKNKAEESNRLKSEFLRNMSHEIRTPMNGIIGFAKLLDKPEISDEKRKSFSQIIRNSSQQLLCIIDDILEISTLETKQETINESEFNLNDLIMELYTISSLKAKERNIPIYVKKQLKDNDSNIITDKSKLHRILTNLLENAIKFTNKGYIEVGYTIEGKNVILYVKDTGVGISPQNMENIFERFAQEEKELSRQFGGLGLGLSISKENALLLGGDITLESEKGKGTTFYLAIPFKTSQISKTSN